MTVAVSAQGLTKKYGPTLALNGLTFEIAAGKVTGFLGPNGAGKTTTFRVLLGLTRPDSGSATVAGLAVASELAAIVKKVGAIVDEPGLLRPLTGRQNLAIAAHTLGFGHERIDGLVSFVELDDAIDRPVSGYSKGMRQRLALAAAMVGDPEILFLDEPLDGLDPAGQHIFKERIRQLASVDGRTVVISSHNLTDVQAVAQDVVVIARGALRFQGPLDAMIGGASGVVVTVEDRDGAMSVLAAAGIEATVRGSDVFVGSDDGSGVVRILTASGIFPSAVIPQAPSIEEAFLAMTGDNP